MTTIDLSATGDAVVHDLPHDAYLAHPALSASGAKVLVQPGGPARYAWQRTHPTPPTDRMDLGTAAHALVLGAGPGLEVIDAPDWRGKTAREQRDQARAAGLTPILAADSARVLDMAAALRAHPVASRLMHPDTGRPEVSLFWHDPEYDVDRKCRVDWLRTANPDGRLLLVDYKSTSSADPAAVDRAIGTYRYDLSAAWYRDVIIGLGLATTVPVLLVFQETTAPYLVNVVELDQQWLAMGYDSVHRALTLYAECTESGRWPGFEGITVSTPPAWVLRQHDDRLAADL